MFEVLPLSEDTVRQLLATGCEHSQLDFKGSCDLRKRRDTVEIAKDVGAFAMDGGYIVVGANDRGEVMETLDEATARLFDEATLRSKLVRYVDGVEVRSQWFQLRGHHLALICVLPHPDGWSVFRQDGTYEDDHGERRFAFRAGEVFARHGSSSERWSQADAHEARQKIRRAEAARARVELRKDFVELLEQGEAAQASARGPATTLTLDLDAQLLLDAVVEQLRAGDLIPLRLMLASAPVHVLAEAQSEEGDVDALLDRLISLAGRFALLERHDQLRWVVDSLSRVYDDLVLGPFGQDRRDLQISPDDVRFRIVMRIYALGALLVRIGAWADVRYIAAVPPRGVANADYWGNWLVHGDVMAARAGIHTEQGDQDRYRSTLLYAQEHIAALGALRPDVSSGSEQIVASLCQFSFLVCLVAIDTAPQTNPDPFLAQFAVYPSSYSDPAVDSVVTNSVVRDAIFPRSDVELAEALRVIANEVPGMRQGYFDGWFGYSSPRVLAFLEANPPERTQ